MRGAIVFTTILVVASVDFAKAQNGNEAARALAEAEARFSGSSLEEPVDSILWSQCEGITLESAHGQPVDLVPVLINPIAGFDEEAQPTFAFLLAEGHGILSFPLLWNGSDAPMDLVIPAHPSQDLAGGPVEIVLAASRDGTLTLCKPIAFAIDPLLPASNAVATSLEAIETLGASVSALNATLASPVLGVDALGTATAGVLAEIIAQDDLDQKGVKLRDALLAKAGSADFAQQSAVALGELATARDERNSTISPGVPRNFLRRIVDVGEAECPSDVYDLNEFMNEQASARKWLDILKGKDSSAMSRMPGSRGRGLPEFQTALSVAPQEGSEGREPLHCRVHDGSNSDSRTGGGHLPPRADRSRDRGRAVFVRRGP